MTPPCHSCAFGMVQKRYNDQARIFCRLIFQVMPLDLSYCSKYNPSAVIMEGFQYAADIIDPRPNPGQVI